MSINYQEFLDYLEKEISSNQNDLEEDLCDIDSYVELALLRRVKDELIRNHEAFERQRVIDFHTVADARLPDFHQPSEDIILKPVTEKAIVITIYEPKSSDDEVS